MHIVVIGTGYVGLVTGTCLAEVGHNVTCVDIDEQKINKLIAGDAPFYEPGLGDLIKKNQHADRLHFTVKLQQAVGTPDAIFFALPTPPNGDGEADLSYVLQAAGDVATLLTKYTIVINKSTVPVGTAQKVRDVIAAKTKTPFDVVSNPEFLREGFAVSDFMNPDRIVVGTRSKKARAVIEEVYKPFTQNSVPLLIMDEASSEMTKYAANSFLATKISFMNEVANLCELVGADVDLVREGIGLDERIGKRFLNAGIGYGGSCFPKDVLALHKIANHHDYDFKMLQTVMDVNRRQKHVIVDKVVARYGENLSGKTFALWGLAFKADTDDMREAPSLDIIRELHGRGARIVAYDPEAVLNAKRIIGNEITYVHSAEEAAQGAHALIIATEWKEFAAADVHGLAKALKDKTVFDGRNIFELDDMQAAGLTYVSIGRKAQNA
ncbi:MAG TPA: UDP-glucose/GDP-mannose dehydrogenase family protein [Candidatus Saccharimonadales bacterium]|nr:UDP-glucose/GDP-mannose dehydrogenase family protein [Candidatus Saccharimonadales bacterium]